MSYTISRNGRRLTITKTNIPTLYVDIFSQVSCEEDECINCLGTPITTDIYEIVLPNKDSTYIVTIKDNIFIDDTHTFTVYDTFLKTVIEDIEYVLCGCKCETCDDCDKKEKDYLSAITRILTYMILHNGLYYKYLEKSNHCVKCGILDLNTCQLASEAVLGNSDSTLLMKQIIAYYYLVLYYTDFLFESDNTEKILSYKYMTMLKCIKKLGIDVECIRDSILTPEPPIVLDGIYTKEFNPVFQ